MGIVINYPIADTLDAPLCDFKKSDIIIFPTETVYGIGCDFFNAEGIDRVFQIKGRENKPLSMHLAERENIALYAENISGTAEKAIEKFLPGPLMMILNAKAGINFPQMTTLDKKIGIRVVDNKITAAVIKAMGGAMAGTSANLSGGGSPVDFFEIPQELIDECDYAIDNGPTRCGADSTVVDFSGEIPVLLREGAISYERLSDELSIKIRRIGCNE